MGKRRARRLKKRMPCSLRIGSSRHSGVVLDLSAIGLFVQTSASPAPGESVQLELNLPGVGQPVQLGAEVARKRVVPARLKAIAHGGIGVSIVSAPEEFYAYVAGLMPEEFAEPEPEAPPPKREKTKLEKRARVMALERLKKLSGG